MKCRIIINTDLLPRVITIAGIAVPMNISARLLKYSMPKMKARMEPPIMPLPGNGIAIKIGRKIIPYLLIFSA